MAIFVWRFGDVIDAIVLGAIFGLLAVCVVIKKACDLSDWWHDWKKKRKDGAE